MTIGIDLDNTLLDTQAKMYDYIYSDERETELLENIEALTSGNTKNDMVKYFYQKYAIEIFENAKLMPGAKDAVDYLVQNGHKVVFITLRGDFNKLYAGSESVTIDYLKRHNIPYSKIIFNSRDKVKACKEEKIDIMLDDSLKVISRMHKNTKGILFNPSNKPNFGCTEVSNWQEFINIIKEIS